MSVTVQTLSGGGWPSRCWRPPVLRRCWSRCRGRVRRAGGQPAAQAESRAGARRRRSEPGAAGSVDGRFPRRQRPHAADGRPGGLRARPAVRPDDVHAAQEPAGARVDARGLRADLRDVQDLPGHAGQVHPAARGLHRRDHGALLRRAASTSTPIRVVIILLFSLIGIARQLRRRVVRHPRQHVRQLARGVRQPARASRSRSTRFRCAPA